MNAKFVCVEGFGSVNKSAIERLIFTITHQANYYQIAE